jgi:hypothetical protein
MEPFGVAHMCATLVDSWKPFLVGRKGEKNAKWKSDRRETWEQPSQFGCVLKA